MDVDPNHRVLHKVTLVQLSRYKAGLLSEVTAICGHVYSPKFPIQNMRKLDKCVVCFPPAPKYAIAA